VKIELHVYFVREDLHNLRLRKEFLTLITLNYDDQEYLCFNVFYLPAPLNLLHLIGASIRKSSG